MFFKKRKLEISNNLIYKKQEEQLDLATMLISNGPIAQTAYISNTKNYVYMSVPKVACTTVKRVLLAWEGYGLVPEHRVNDVHFMADELRLREYDHYEVKTFLRDPTMFKFAFVRNPYDRMFSAWKSKIRDDDVNFRWLTYDIRKWSGSKLITFKDFVEYISTTDDHRALTEAHFIDQWELIRPDLIKYNKIGRFERFEYDFTVILMMLSAPQHVMDLTKTKTNYTNQLPLKSVYDQELADLVYWQSKRTFEHFGYAVDSWKEL